MHTRLRKATFVCLVQAAVWAGLPTAASAVPIRFDYTGSFTSYTVATTGVYQIFAFGAQGGTDAGANAGGKGAEAAGDFTLTAGQVLNIAVGGMGRSGALSGGGGGGGGTFLSIASTLVLVAGGGGGGGAVNNDAADGQAGMSGASGYVYGPGLYGAGGTAGRGGAGSSDPTGTGGAGGGGVLTNGGNNGGGLSIGGASLANGLAGGSGSPYAGNGGFGGGGGGDFEGGSGGGGGGYSGGGGGGFLGSGGGGGSFDAALVNLDRFLASGVNQGNGFLSVELLPAAVTQVPEPSNWTLLSLGLIGLVVARPKAARGRTIERLGRLALTTAALFASIATASAAPVFTTTTPGMTSVTLAAGTYDIVAAGASGGTTVYDPTNLAGVGAIVEGTFTFLSSTLLDILVGGMGGSQPTLEFVAGAGGGGGTFIVGAANTPLLIAGGGGGAGNGYDGGSARGIATSGGAGGSQGDDFAGGGGGGLLGDGTGSRFGGNGRAYVNGGAGGRDQYGLSGNGGVGGGGGAGLGGGGGGGYTGGSTSSMGGDGGTSFDAGLDPIFSLATFVGDGAVTITRVIPAAIGVPEPEGMALFGIGLLGVITTRRTRRSRAAPVVRDGRSFRFA